MIITTDCGSTKTDWALNNGEEYIQTLGFNPNFVDGESFINSAQRKLQNWPLQDPNLHVHFYGTGQTENNIPMTLQLLRVLFPLAQIHVNHDLLGACRACCGDQPGLIGILGTGSNSCVYDGEKIVDQVPSLGYVLGDEGSGGNFGRLFILSYFYRRMPEHFRAIVHQHYPAGEEELKKLFLGSKQQNIFLANFGAYFKEHREDPFYQQIITESFQLFIQNHLINYTKFPYRTVHFVGSIAFHFAHILKRELEKEGFTLGNIVKKPIEQLVQYHFNPE